MSATQEAPGELELVRAFVNTLDVEDGVEQLADPAALERWLRRHHVLRGGPRPGDEELLVARRLREAIRTLLLGYNGVSVRKEAALVLGRTAERARLALVFDPDGNARLQPPASGGEGAPRRLPPVGAGAVGRRPWAPAQ